MTARTKLGITAAIAVIGLTAFSLWTFRERERDSVANPAASAQTPTPEPQTALEPASAEPENAAPVEAASASADDSPEVAATRRMYMAHAPLREPELADPDSETNRLVLETMVRKALNRDAASAAPAEPQP